MTDADMGPLDSGQDLQRAAADIVGLFNNDPDRLLAAAANPILALRDAGLQLDAATERWVAHRCRFDETETERLDELVTEIEKQLGPIDPDDDDALLARFAELDIEVGEVEKACRAAARPAPAAAEEATVAHRPPPTAKPDPDPTQGPVDRPKGRPIHPGRRSALQAGQRLASTRKWREVKPTGADPFELLRDAHDVVEPLLAYRAASRRRSRFASEDLYRALADRRGGQLATGVNISLRVTLSEGA